jgi:disulfide oxidoreductase YuzD
VPLSNRGIKITILGDNSQGECDANCGIDWTSPESVPFAAERIRDRFGEDIPIKYIDMTENKTVQLVQEWTENVKNKNLSLPLLLLNGQLRISGQFDIRQLLDVIEIEKEVSGF